MSAIFFSLHFTLVDFILFRTTMANTFEFKLQTPTASKIDLAGAEMAKSIADLKDSLTNLKDQIINSQDQTEAEGVFAQVKESVYADDATLTLRVGDKYITATDDAEYAQWKALMESDLDAANQEISQYMESLKNESDFVTNQTKEEVTTMKNDLTGKKLIKKKTTETQKTRVTEFTYKDAEDEISPTETADEQPVGKEIAKLPSPDVFWNEDPFFANIKSIAQLDKAFERNPAYANLSGAMNNDDVVNALRNYHQNPGSVKGVKIVDDYYHITTRNPLFITKENPKGKICIPVQQVEIEIFQPKASPAPDNYDMNNNPDAYDHRQNVDSRMQVVDQCYPGAADSYKNHGVLGAFFGKMAENTNLKDKDAKTIANLCKIATGGAMLFFGIRSVIDLFSASKRKRGLTTLGVMAGLELGSRMAFGEGINSMLNGKNPKDAWDAFCKKFNFDAVSTENVDNSTIDQVMDPATVQAMIQGISWEDQKLFTVENSDGSVTVDPMKYKEYITTRASTDTGFRATLSNRLEALKVLVDKNVLQPSFNQFYIANAFNPFTVDLSKKDQTPENELASTTAIRNTLIELRKGYKTDADKMAAYIGKLKKENRDASTVTIDELKDAGVITGVLAKEVLDTDPIDPTLQALVDANKLTKRDAQSLTKAKTQLTEELVKVGSQDAGKDMEFKVVNDAIYLHSHGWSTGISKVGDMDDWKVGSFDHNFSGTYEAIRVATLTNFIITHYKGTVDKGVEGPFNYNDRNLNIRQHTAMTNLGNLQFGKAIFGTAVVDGADGFASSLSKIGGSAFESQAGKYAAWLNSLKGTDGKTSMWYMGNDTGVTWETVAPLAIIASPDATTPNAAPNATPNAAPDAKEKEKIPFVSEAEALADMEKYNLMFTTAEHYEWMEPNHETGNYATVPYLTEAEAMEDMNKNNLQFVPLGADESWADPANNPSIEGIDLKKANYAIAVIDPQSKKPRPFPVPVVTWEQMIKDRKANHVLIKPKDGFVWAHDKNVFDNFHVVKKGEEIKPLTLDDMKKDRKAHHVLISPKTGYEFVEPQNMDNMATRELNAWAKTKEWTADKWTGFKGSVSDLGTWIGKTFDKMVAGDLFKKEPSNTVIYRRKHLTYLKDMLSDLERQGTALDKSVITATEIGLIKIHLEETEEKLAKIENMWGAEIDPGLTPADKQFDSGWTDAQKKELTTAEKKINFELKFKDKNDTAHFITYKDKSVRLASWAQETPVRIEGGKYFLDKFMVPFDNAEDVVRMANLTNFLKIHFKDKATTNVDNPWIITNDGDLEFKDQTTWDATKKLDWK